MIVKIHMTPVSILFNTAEKVKLESNEPRLLLPLRIMLFCFDFAGSGISEGEYISLGWCFDSILNRFGED